MMKPHPALNNQQIRGVGTLLNLLLADECLLYSKTRNCHWNAAGSEIRPLRELFEQQYDKLSDIIDGVANRGLSWGAQAMGTMSEFLQYARLKEHPGKRPPAARMLAHLLEDHEAIVCTLRGDRAVCSEEFSDSETSEFLAGLMEQHENMARMLRAHLENS